MSAVTILGGVSEIGGNKIVVEDGDTRILLDFGMSLGARSRFFEDPYVSPRTEASLLELGILPRLGGFYKWDEKVSVDAVVLSHAHLDHYGYLSMMNRSIPVYCGETTKTLMEAITETKRASVESDYRGIRYETFRTGSVVKIGRVTIRPVHVDHSLPGAYGFLLELSDGTLAYTGDLRAHGRKNSLTRDFVEQATSLKPDMLISEGTNMVGATVSSEEEVAGKIASVVARAKGLVVASFSTMDVDRLTSFYEAAQTNGRTLALSMRQAYLLRKLREDKGLALPALTDERIAVYKRPKQRYEKWEQEVCENAEVVTPSDFAKGQRDFVFAASISDMEGLLEVKPESDSAYILSSSEPFNEEMELSFDRLLQWLDHYGMAQYHIHVSGHIMPQDLRGAIASISARTVVPVHTEHPELFRKFMTPDASKVIVPTSGTPIPLKR